MTKVLVVHGAGINMRGKFQVEIFGTATMDDYTKQINEYASGLGVLNSGLPGLGTDEVFANSNDWIFAKGFGGIVDPNDYITWDFWSRINTGDQPEWWPGNNFLQGLYGESSL